MLGFAIACAAALVFAGGIARAQSNEPRVGAQLSSGVAKLGENVILQVTAENTESATIDQAPQVDGLLIQAFGRPSTNVSEEFFNGRFTRSATTTWSTSVRPQKIGEFVIPSIAVLVGSKTLRTAPLNLTVVADLKGEELGFIQIVPSSAKVVEGEPFSVEIRFGWDARKTSFNYAILSFPWWDQLPGTLANEPAPVARKASNAYFFVNNNRFDEVQELDRTTQSGVSYRTFRIVRTFTPTRSGALEFPMSSLEFGRVVSRDDFFAFRQSLERAETFYARAEPLKIEVVPLPEKDKPLDFGGAIGKLDVKATAEPRDVDVGDSIKFKVEWSGAANFEFFEPPAPDRQDAFKGFRVYGKTETKSVDRRTVVYDIAPLKTETTEIPSLETPYFDPETMQYGRAKTAPIAIHVRPLKNEKSLADANASEHDSRDLVDIDARAERRPELPRIPGGLVLGGLIAAPAIGLSLRRWARVNGDPDAPAAKRRRRAKKRLAKELSTAREPLAQQSAFCEFLAARTAEPREAWIGRRVHDGVALKLDRGLEPELARELDGQLDELERAAWSGESRSIDNQRVLALADRLIAGGL